MGKTWLNPGCLLKAELVGTADKSYVECYGKRSQENFSVFILSIWRNGVAMKWDEQASRSGGNVRGSALGMLEASGLRASC